jgi:hypothetical protein
VKKWQKVILGCFLFLALERFCYFQTGTFSLSKMIYEDSPPSPTSITSSVQLAQPLRFLGAGKQFYAFETADGQYVVKFMKWSRRRPLPWIQSWMNNVPLAAPFLQNCMAARAKMAAHLQKSGHLALKHLPAETQLVVPQPSDHFTLIDKLGITHTINCNSTHYYVQRKAIPFTDYLKAHPSEAKPLLLSFIQTVKAQCQQGISNLDPIIERNYGVVKGRVILLDIGSFLASPLPPHALVIELLPLRNYLQKHYPEHLALFDELLAESFQLA